MTDDDIESYIETSREQVRRISSGVKDFSVFDFNYIPAKPLIRAEVKRLIDYVVRYQQTGIPQNLVVVGARGSGKTLMLKYLTQRFSEKLQLPFRAVNCRIHNTSFKVLAKILNVRPRGYSYSELCDRFEVEIPGKCVIVLDEVDLLSEKDFRKDVLYFLSRSANKYCVVLLSNNPKFLNSLDESTRSSLQPDLLHFSNYSAQQIQEILSARAAAGLRSSDNALLAQIAALTARNSNSDIRIALKTLLYMATDQSASVEECFERARQDIILDILRSLNDKAVLILRAVLEEPTGFVKAVYQHYVSLSQSLSEEPYSYVYFYNNLSYLQSIGLVMLLSAKVDRAYTNRIHPLVSKEQFQPVYKARFQ